MTLEQKVVGFVFFIALFVVAGLVSYIAYKRAMDHKMRRSHSVAVFVFSLLLVSFANSIVTVGDLNQFNLLHLHLIVVCAYLPFVLHIMIKSETGHKAVMYSFAGLMAIFLSMKFFYDMPVYQMIPLNVCNLAAVFVVLRPFYKNKILDNYLLIFAFLGSIANIVLGAEYGRSFFVPQIFESNMVHHLFLTLTIYMMLKKEVVPDIKLACKNFIWIVPCFAVLVFTNEIWKFNFFYTSRYENPILAIYNVFPKFDVNILGQNFEFNPIYYVVVIAATFGLVYGLSWAFTKVNGIMQHNNNSEFRIQNSEFVVELVSKDTVFGDNTANNIAKDTVNDIIKNTVTNTETDKLTVER